MTSLERINLARRHLQGNFEEIEKNPTGIIFKLSQGEFINLQKLLEALQSETNLTIEALRDQEQEQ